MDSNTTGQSLDLNSAELDELAQLAGVGPKLAARIVAHRDEAPFQSKEDIMQVPGISAAKYARWADQVTVAAPAEETPPGPPSEPESLTAVVPWDITTARANRVIRPARDWTGLIGTGLVGAFFGALLALLVVAALNRGTLVLNQREQVVTLTDRTDELGDRATALESEASALRTRLDSLEALTGRVENVEASVEDLSAAAEAASAEIDALDERTAALSDDIELVRSAAERFNRFLDGLRDLLFQFQGAPTPTPTPEVTATPNS